ncbi:MAG: PilZ domain-containing protein [Thermodesulfobacteriota bacterium]
MVKVRSQNWLKMEDRRLSKRIPLRRKIKYGLSDPAFSGYSFNLSESGIGIKSTKAFLNGSNAMVYIYFGEEIIKIEGVVARVDYHPPETGSTIGIKFTSRKDYLKLHYNRYVQQAVGDALE